MLKLRDRHTILNKWVDVKSAVPIEQMREVVQQQQKVQSQKAKASQKKGQEVFAQAILTFPNLGPFAGENGSIQMPVLMQMPQKIFQQPALIEAPVKQPKVIDTCN